MQYVSMSTQISLDIISETELQDVKPSTFPLELQTKLLNDDGDIIDEPNRYHRLIGCRIFLSTNRPKINYVIHVLSQFMKIQNRSIRRQLYVWFDT